MKKILLIVLTICCIFSLSACNDEEANLSGDAKVTNVDEQVDTDNLNSENEAGDTKQDEEEENTSVENTTDPSNENKTDIDDPVEDQSENKEVEQDQNQDEEKGENLATLYAVHSMGEVEGTEADIEKHDYYYDGYLSIKMLADALSELTGLDFSLVEVMEDFGTYTVRWADDSTLIANPIDQETKEGFFFHDADSMRWFMMDSLYKTIMENTDAIEVFYLTADGQELSFDELQPVNAFGTSMPYMGSGFYYNHADDVWEDVIIYDNSLDQWSQGTWYLNGDYNSDYIILETFPSYTSCHADGTVKSEGKFGYFAGSGPMTKYALTDADGNIVDTFIFRSNTTFLLENEDLTYEKLQPNIPVLTGATHFTGLISDPPNNNYRGGYYYSDLTEDGLTKIINTGYASTLYDEPVPTGQELPILDEEVINRYIKEQAKDLTKYNTHYLSTSDSSPRNLTITRDETLETYGPTYILSWESGEGEEARKWTAMFFDTYYHTYIYAFSTAADFADDMEDVWIEQFEKLSFSAG